MTGDRQSAGRVRGERADAAGHIRGVSRQWQALLTSSDLRLTRSDGQCGK